MPGSRTVAPVALAVIAIAALAGCGSSASPSAASKTTGTGVLVTPAGKQASGAGVKAVAYVEGTPITVSSYKHWMTVEHDSGQAADASHRALAFLITSSWVLGEAAARHITVSEAEVSKHLHALERKRFPKPGQLQRFLAKNHESSADLLARVRAEMLSDRIAEHVEGNGSQKSRSAALARFERSFKAHWRSLTSCSSSYVMEDCKQYKGSGEPGLSAVPTSSSSASSSSAHEGAKTASGTASSSSSGGEVPAHPGAFTVESPAFLRNGAIPAKYTCDGAGASPPLRWSNVPKHASELVLFVIDDTSSGKSGGIRWVVGGIDPGSREVAAGQTPAGGIVGTSSSGSASYGPICPAAGHTDTIEIVMYALRKKIALTPGFQPSIAEQEYGSTKDLLGEAAVTYGVYHRP